MAHTILVLDLRSLCSFTCTRVSNADLSCRILRKLPAPGGPIKIMRIASEGLFELEPEDRSPSSLSNRAVRFATCVFRSSTCLSDIVVTGGGSWPDQGTAVFEITLSGMTKTKGGRWCTIDNGSKAVLLLRHESCGT